jgi:hypothetical protein
MFIVVSDDDGSFCWLMGCDPDCEGAICVNCSEPAVFETRKLAQKAIRISKAFAALRATQGLSVNEDFTSFADRIKIRPLREYKATGKAGQ